MTNSHIKYTWLEWEIKDGQHEQVLVIVTDLEIRSHAKNFDPTALENMVATALRGHEAIGAAAGRVRVVPQGALHLK